METTEIQRLVRDYCKGIYNNKMDNLEEMDKILRRYNLSRMNQQEMKSVSRPIRSTENESVIKELTTNRSLLTDGITGEFYQSFEKS